jgi:hypothetical protein
MNDTTCMRLPHSGHHKGSTSQTRLINIAHDCTNAVSLRRVLVNRVGPSDASKHRKTIGQAANFPYHFDQLSYRAFDWSLWPPLREVALPLLLGHRLNLQ